jgi:hypothetical protein
MLARMTTLHIENQVRDFDSWKAAFDKFERFRAEQGVRAYRISRSVTDPHQVMVDLDFDSVTEATAFRQALEQIWRTPQSREQLVDHAEPVVLDVVVERQPRFA